MPLNCHFVAAEVRERGAEMAQVQRIAPVMLPPANLGAAAVGAGEETAEMMLLMLLLQLQLAVKG